MLFIKFNSSQSEFTTGLIIHDQNKGQQPYVLIETSHYLKYLDQFLIVVYIPLVCPHAYPLRIDKDIDDN